MQSGGRAATSHAGGGVAQRGLPTLSMRELGN